MKNVIVADHHQEVLRTFKLELERGGYCVPTARNGGEVLDLIEQQPVNLILAEVDLPQVNGYQLFRAVKNNPRSAWIPVILLSNRPTESDLRYSRSIGVDDHLPKNIPAEDLLAIVQGKILAAERLRSLYQPLSDAVENSSALMLTVNQCPLQIDFKQHRAWLDEIELQLTTSEIFLLEHLVQRPNRLLGVQELFTVTHGGQAVGKKEAGRLMRPLICTLRRKLKDYLGEPDCIKNVRGHGYIFVVG